MRTSLPIDEVGGVRQVGLEVVGGHEGQAAVGVVREEHRDDRDQQRHRAHQDGARTRVLAAPARLTHRCPPEEVVARPRRRCCAQRGWMPGGGCSTGSLDRPPGAAAHGRSRCARAGRSPRIVPVPRQLFGFGCCRPLRSPAPLPVRQSALVQLPPRRTCRVSASTGSTGHSCSTRPLRRRIEVRAAAGGGGDGVGGAQVHDQRGAEVVADPVEAVDGRDWNEDVLHETVDAARSPDRLAVSLSRFLATGSCSCRTG